MRFKAELAYEQLQLLNSLIGPISRLSQRAIVYLDPEYVRISSRDGDGISCFAELKANGGIFLQHRVESVAENAIVFEIDLLQWRTAMQSIVGEDNRRHFSNHQEEYYGASHNNTGAGAGASSNGNITIMKLAKRHGGIPCLCLDGKCAGSVEVYHAIPIRVMRAADMKYHLPPQIQMPDVQLEMTNEKPLRVVIDRLKSISPHVYMEGSMEGNLTLRIDSDGSSIRTFFSKLLPRFEDTKSSQDEQQDPARCCLKVDTKKLSTCLQWQSTMTKNVSSALLCMVENEMLVVHVLLNPASVGFFTYYVPVHFLSSAELAMDN